MIYLAVGKSMKNFHGISLVKEVSLRDAPIIFAVQVGTVISLKGHDGRVYCHRVVKLENDLVTTKGDNFIESKPYEIDVPVKNIRGVITWTWPYDILGVLS